jgi:formylglycine-generating enzyme required for sulfatase activity
MSRHLVTNAQFRAFVEEEVDWSRERMNESLHNGHYLEHWNEEGTPTGQENVPVTNVSWYAAEAYCRWQGGHLPTEAQWEWAARGGQDRTKFPWGDEMPDNSQANWHGNGIDHPVPVGQYPPNEYGLHDLAGNAWEFCLDEWQEDFYSKSPLDNPLAGAETPDFDFLGITSRRVVRGGSWGAAAINMRVTYRDSHPPLGAGDHVGFRCVMTSEQRGG